METLKQPRVKPVFWRNRVFIKQTTIDMLIKALFTAIVVFASSLALTLQKSTDITALTLLAAFLAAVAAFFTILLEYYRK